MPTLDKLPGGLPAGAELLRVAYLPQLAGGEAVLCEFSAPFRLHAVRVTDAAPGGAAAGRSAPTAELSVLTIPTEMHDDVELLARARRWVEQPGAGGAPRSGGPPEPSQMSSLQAAQICWAPGRFAILAPDDRLIAVRNAVLEVAYFEHELREIERQLGADWPALEADIPQAFAADEQTLARRRTLRERFERVLLLRARLARIAPFLLAPHVYPPTLASQIGERLRERTRVHQRIECLREQLEVFERVYEMCGQRSSDFVLTRSSNTLEWVIIILLLAQILLSLFDMLPAVAT